MHKLSLIAAFIFMSSALSRAESDKPQVGGSAPGLALETILQAPPGTRANWSDLKGKVVVLEFWATWCGPCLAAIPHLNDLAGQFKDKPVQFIAITDEKEPVIVPFLKKRPIHAWVGLDTNRSASKAYGIDAIPHTVVVDQTGKIVAITHPSKLTAQHLEEVLAGKVPAFATRQSGQGVEGEQVSAGGKRKPEPLFEVLIRPTETTAVTSVSNPGSLTLSGSSLLDVLAICSNIPSGRIFTNSPLPDGRFEFMIKTPSKKPHVVHDLLRQAIENAFGLVVRHETKVVDLLVLTAGTGAAEHLSPTAVTGRSSSSSGGGSLRGVNLGIDSLSASLEGFLGRPVVNETQLTNRYDFQLLWDEEGPADAKSERISAAVREQLGLVLTPSQRPLEVVIVEAAGGEQRQSFPDKQQTKSW